MQAGLGNVTAGCLPCQCSNIGASSHVCDPESGQCSCHPGVASPFCETCLPDHYGYSDTGCKSEFLYNPLFFK